MTDGPLQLLFPTDVFPPRAGGAGWSTHALARAMQDRGHQVIALVPKRDARGLSARVESGIHTIEVGYWAPGVPFLANIARFERFWPRFAQIIARAGRLADGQRSSETICEQVIANAPGAQPAAPNHSLLIHGQHIQSIGAGVLAGQRLGAPVVGTVRDHWPWHYFDTGLHGNQVPVQHFGPAATATDLIARSGPLAGTFSLVGLPYVLAHVRRRASLLARCDAVISLSGYITRRLVPLIAPHKLHPIPNVVDLELIDRITDQPPQTPIERPFILFAGKLARNKGAHLLPEVMAAMQAAGAHANLVIAGGSDPALLQEFQERGIAARALDWADHDEVLRLMAHCAALVFPSSWGEPLSRVLLEACAVGVPIAAMPTGGTPDLLTNGINGLLARTPGELGRALARLVQQPQLADLLAAGARHTAETRLAAPVVASQVEELYRTLLRSRHGRTADNQAA